MKRRKLTIALIAVVAALILISASFYTIGEWEQALIIQLGKPVKNVQEAGLHVKIPFIQSVNRFDRRLLEYDVAPRELLTIDKQQLVVDNYARWKIVDPLLYYKTVRTEAGAQSRLDDIIYSNLRESLGRQTLRDIVSLNRSEIMTLIIERSKPPALKYGINIVDIRIKRADLPEKNEQNVFQRMRAERERQAKRFRAEGDEESRKIKSSAEKESRIIIAEANRTSQIIKGEGDAKSTLIYARAYNRDPEFYSFFRSLQAYRKSLTKDTTLVLPPESQFFKYLK
jgi:membrane protease subunit HflC